MKTTVKNGDIHAATQALGSLLRQPFPVSISLELATLAKALQPQAEILADVRNGLVRKYHNQEEGKAMAVKPDTLEREKYDADFKELMEKEAEVDFKPVNLLVRIEQRCPKCGEASSTPFVIDGMTILALDKFVTFENGQKPAVKGKKER